MGLVYQEDRAMLKEQPERLTEFDRGVNRDAAMVSLFIYQNYPLGELKR
jgi:hypothetical protein